MNPGTQTQGLGPDELAHRQDEPALARRIQAGDEDAFVQLACLHQSGFVRLAQAWVHDVTLAEAVVRETWVVALAALQLERLPESEGRSSIKAWLCGILIDKARERQRREGRLADGRPVNDPSPRGDHPPAVPSDRFNPPGHRWDGHWLNPLTAWPDTPSDSVLSIEMRGLLDNAIARLPESQRAVLLLRDVEGLSGEEVCNLLGVLPTHQRVLLHRARAQLRALLERHFHPSELAREELP